MAINIEGNFEPAYEVSEDKKKLLKELLTLSKKAEVVWLATDEDREGEAISWHLQEALGLTDDKIRRIVFSEITKNAILKAIDTPRDVNINLVNAQQARRVLDRLVGFELSPVLWKKVKPSLSAGRVQSVAVRIIVEREKEISNFKSISSYRLTAEFKVGNSIMKAELPKRIEKIEDASSFVKDCLPAEYSIEKLETKPAKKSPAGPFTTSTLQQEASRKLGFSVSQTMVVAQRLYEAGRITYMRTDSVNLSEFALESAENEIKTSYGPEYAKRRTFSSKSKGAQEAHEAIRPTDMATHKIDGERNEERLYDLIWKRTIASQMSDAQLEKTTASVGISTRSELLVAKGEVIKFEGFLKVYLEGTDDENEEDSTTKGMLPPLSVGQNLELAIMNATQRFNHHPARYTEASLVKKLEELGIGRPSTYAPTIGTIQKRGYAVKEDRDGKPREYQVMTLKSGKYSEETLTETTGTERGKLFPTDIGRVVNDFLVEHFGDILDYSFTASVEKEFDDIANGELVWNEMIKKFYQPFHKKIDSTLEHADRASGERILGEHPESGKVVLVRIGRFGPMAQIGDSEDEEKRFASLLPDQSITSINLEQALDLFKLPRTLGDFEGKTVAAAIGRFGPYVRHDGKFVSIKEDDGDNPFSITLERAIELIQAKREKDAKAILRTFDEDPEIRVLEGRWGPYIKAGKDNVKIPKGTEHTDLSFDEINALVEEHRKNPPKKRRRK